MAEMETAEWLWRVTMENKNLEQVKELINRIADSYALPSQEQVAEMQGLTNKDWEAEDLQEICCEYWSHNSLEETAYLLFHGDYPPVQEVELIFWKYKQGVVLDDQAVYDKYRFWKGKAKGTGSTAIGGDTSKNQGDVSWLASK